MASALKAIREHCVLCVNGKAQKSNLEIIKTCEHEKCPLWPYRMGVRPTDGTPHRPLKACRTFCVEECLAGVPSEVPTCQGDQWVIAPCPLYPFRMGKNPNISPAARERMKDRARHFQ